MKLEKHAISIFYNIPKAIFLLLVALMPSAVSAQALSEKIGGLEFYSSEESIDKLSSLELPAKGLIPISNQFELSFELNLQKSQVLGNILRIILDDDQVIDLKYEPKINAHNPHLVCIINKDENFASLPIAKSNLKDNKWVSVHLSVNLESQNMRIEYGEKVIDKNISLSHSKNLKLIFGVSQEVGFRTKDVPKFAVRDINLKSKSTSLQWPLRQYHGDIAVERSKKINGKITTPLWTATKHHLWENIANFENSYHPAVLHDPVHRKIIVVGTKSTLTFCIENETVKKIPHKKSIDNITYWEGLYVPVLDKIGIFDFRGSKIKLNNFDELLDSLESISQIDQQLTNWRQCTLLDLNKGNIFRFGGYGHYTFKNDFTRYDLTTESWETVDFSGNTIAPRYLSSSGHLTENAYLVYGGMGNKTGNQVLGTNAYHDLYLVNLDSMSVQKLWSQKHPLKGYTCGSNLILDKSKKYFYTLLFPYNSFDAQIKLAKISIADGTIEWASETLDMPYKDIESRLFLFQDQKNEDFYAVASQSDFQSDKSQTHIYKLRGTPLSISDLENMKLEAEIPDADYTLAYLALLIILAITSLLYFKKYRSKRIKPETEASNKDIDTMLAQPFQSRKLIKIDYPKKNAIYIFDGLKIYDHAGNEISDQFTEKPRQLFLIILFFPYLHGRNISSQEIVDILWPNAEKSKSRNNRSITIKRLRLLLSPIEGVEIEFKNGTWEIEFNKDSFCDFKLYTQLENQLKTNISSQEIMNGIYSLTRSAEINNNQLEWLAEAISDIKSKIIETLLLCASLSKDANLTVKWASLVLKYDELEEQGMKLKLHGLIKMGKLVLARNEFEKFSKQFESLFGEAYESSFNEIKEEIENNQLTT
ncbi:hypothetical protein [Aureibacter tunicatorum]|uniref:Two-component SAPR family response regulator n=1 Tax=Aureibacter tunicatorum TaxID=866807 RepID=A0AAE3XMG4_9BACT|nr:hypothetical protein [Aureibacter tunicatorum]MDR6238634.1 two-component SAPR family response regulator [Aureibacter tunicatorum]BDD05435.1 hypothetical protein AUTU_29180 [Aureibacter tunicatorum]